MTHMLRACLRLQGTRHARPSGISWTQEYPAHRALHRTDASSVRGLLAMRLRLSDAATSAVLAEHYSAQAEMCHQAARMAVSPFKEGWLELAAEWTKLAREARKAEAKLRR